jgi:hypothetical protein
MKFENLKVSQFVRDLDLGTVSYIAMAYKTTFEAEHTISPIYTGGSVALEQSGRILATTLGEDALLTDLNTGRQLAKIEGVGPQIGCSNTNANVWNRMEN